MKKLFTVIILGIALAGASLAQTSKRENSAETKIAVVEYSTGSNISGMTPEAKRQLQAGIASALEKSGKFDVTDVRWTRNESQDNLAALNGGTSTAAAVKLGTRLGVSYVLTGNVTEYTLKDASGFGRIVFKSRLIEVATGKVVHTEETTQKSIEAMRTTGVAEMHSRTVMPAIKKLSAIIAGLRL